ncbi:MAG TPA: hypothetical protein VGQ27_11030, partial [Steroidobacteraceae bacterium]|nr:hypothetical protein [Steroidobacteraceae bacterium]
MFSWLRKPAAPPPRAAENPGHGHEFTMAFANAGKSWSESGNLLTILAAEMKTQGQPARIRSGWLEHDSGLLLVPHIVAVNPREDSSVHTVSTIQFSHPRWLPRGNFEYQHSTGTTVSESLAAGFKSWMALDLPVMLDAGRETPSECMHIRMDPAREGTSLLHPNRRVIFGPVQHLIQQPAAGTDDHPFCPCCLFTHDV